MRRSIGVRERGGGARQNRKISHTPVDGHADQCVADESDHEDDRVHGNEYPFGLLRHDVRVHQVVLVLFVRHVGRLVVVRVVVVVGRRVVVRRRPRRVHRRLTVPLLRRPLFRRRRQRRRRWRDRRLPVSRVRARQHGERDNGGRADQCPHLVAGLQHDNTTGQVKFEGRFSQSPGSLALSGKIKNRNHETYNARVSVRVPVFEFVSFDHTAINEY